MKIKPELLTGTEVMHMLRSYVGFDMSQNELAAKIGTSRTNLSCMLHGTRLPNKATLEFLGLRKVVVYERISTEQVRT